MWDRRLASPPTLRGGDPHGDLAANATFAGPDPLRRRASYCGNSNAVRNNGPGTVHLECDGWRLGSAQLLAIIVILVTRVTSFQSTRQRNSDSCDRWPNRLFHSGLGACEGRHTSLDGKLPEQSDVGTDVQFHAPSTRAQAGSKRRIHRNTMRNTATRARANWQQPNSRHRGPG